MVIDGTGSVWGDSGCNLVVLGQYNLVLIGIEWYWPLPANSKSRGGGQFKKPGCPKKGTIRKKTQPKLSTVGPKFIMYVHDLGGLDHAQS